MTTATTSAEPDDREDGWATAWPDGDGWPAAVTPGWPNDADQEPGHD